MLVLRRIVTRSQGLGLDHIGLSLFRVVNEQNFSSRRAGIHAVMPGSKRLDKDRSGLEFPPGSIAAVRCRLPADGRAAVIGCAQ
jgi:hypothetical protein